MKWLCQKVRSLFQKQKEPTQKRAIVKSPPIEREFPDLMTNKEGVDLCAECEGLHDLRNGLVYPYKDPVGIPTIGRGTIMYPSRVRVTMKDDPITIKTADLLFKHEIDEKENVIKRHLEREGLEFNSNEFSALVCFAYNLGEHVVTDPSRSMGSAVLSQDRKAIADAFLLYDKATIRKFGIKKKVKLRGLTIRRMKERDLFLS